MTSSLILSTTERVSMQDKDRAQQVVKVLTALIGVISFVFFTLAVLTANITLGAKLAIIAGIMIGYLVVAALIVFDIDW